MLEIQGPGGKQRLGEVIHSPSPPPSGPSSAAEGGATDEKAEEEATPAAPELAYGEQIELSAENEMKDLGQHILICSVAWETLDGRRTFQRFMRFTVNPPLAIKTRVQIPQSANVVLDPVKRLEVFLEVLMQNVSREGVRFSRVLLEAVHGLTARMVDAPIDEGGEGETLLPGDTRQYLFVLSPAPPAVQDSSSSDSIAAVSAFPPSHPPGTILPLGRLDLAWNAGPYAHPGRLQTSTLNRRVPQPKPAASAPTPAPTRTAPSTPQPVSRAGASGQASTSTQGVRASPRPPPPPAKEEAPVWEYDLVLLSDTRAVLIEETTTTRWRLAMRSLAPISPDSDAAPPAWPIVAVQYLSRPASAREPPIIGSAGPSSTPMLPGPSVNIHPPSRGMTPTTPSTPARTPSSARPFSPGTTTPSRPHTPLSAQLRQAVAAQLSHPLTPAPSPAIVPISLVQPDDRPSFPPPPTLPTLPFNQASASGRSTGSPYVLDQGTVRLAGNSMTVLGSLEAKRTTENLAPTYENAPPRDMWEVRWEFTLRFVGWDQGLAELGGLRVLLLDDVSGTGGQIGREWESLGDFWVDE